MVAIRASPGLDSQPESGRLVVAAGGDGVARGFGHDLARAVRTALAAGRDAERPLQI